MSIQIPHTDKPTTDKPTLVFLHGAGVGPWIWDRTRKHLQAESMALTYPGRNPHATPENCAEAVITELNRHNVGDVVLILHSLAGVLAGPLSMKLSSRLKKVILLSALVPAPRQSFVQTMGFPARWVLPLLFRFNSKGLKPSPGMLCNELCHDLSPDDTERVIGQYEAEFPGLFLTPPPPLPLNIPLAYICLQQDRSIPPPIQQKVIQQYKIKDTFTLDAGHLAMLSQPRALAHRLDVVCEKTTHSLEFQK